MNRPPPADYAAVSPLAPGVAVLRPARALIATAALTTLFGLAGCGGGHSGGGAGPKTLPKADFIAQGDAICTDVNTKLDNLPSPNETDGKALASYLRQGAS